MARASPRATASSAYWSALDYWNLTEQVPRVTYVQTTARRENRNPNVLGMKFHIVRVKPRKFFGSHVYRVGELAVRVTDREKTIIDCLDRLELSGEVAEVARALQEGDGEFDWGRTTAYLRRSTPSYWVRAARYHRVTSLSAIWERLVGESN